MEIDPYNDQTFENKMPDKKRPWSKMKIIITGIIAVAILAVILLLTNRTAPEVNYGSASPYGIAPEQPSAELTTTSSEDENASDAWCDTLLPRETIEKLIEAPLKLHTASFYTTPLYSNPLLSDRRCDISFTTDEDSSFLSGGRVLVTFFADTKGAKTDYDQAWSQESWSLRVEEYYDLGVGTNSLYRIEGQNQSLRTDAIILYNNATEITVSLYGAPQDTPESLHRKIYAAAKEVFGRIPGAMDTTPYPFLYGERAPAYPDDWCTNLVAVKEVEKITGKNVSRPSETDRNLRNTASTAYDNGIVISPYLYRAQRSINIYDEDVICMMTFEINAYGDDSLTAIINVYDPPLLWEKSHVTPRSMYEYYKYDVNTLPSLGIGLASVHHTNPDGIMDGRVLLNDNVTIIASISQIRKSDTEAVRASQLREFIELMALRIPSDVHSASTAKETRVRDSEENVLP